MVILTMIALLLVAGLWLFVYTRLGIIPKDYWERLVKSLLGKTDDDAARWDVKHGTGPWKPFKADARKEATSNEDLEEEEVFHDVFEIMDKMNVKEVESFKAYGHRTFYFTCGRCRQKNRLGTDLAKFKKAGCGKCHAKFFGGSSEDVGSQSSGDEKTDKDKRAN
jgi:hypothetical protein